MTAKHRRPRSAGRNLAATAAVLSAGALPLAAAGSAFADAAPLGSALPLSSLPLDSLPLDLGSAAGPASGAVPLAGAVTSTVTGAVGAGELQIGGDLVDGPDTAAQTRDASMYRQTASAAAGLAGKTRTLADRLAAEMPVNGLLNQVAPTTGGGPVRLEPTLLHGGAVGTLTDGYGRRAMDLTGGVVHQVQPAVSQLHGQGVPTVGDVTTSLSGTDVPMVGDVGTVTSTIPVSSMLGDQSPVMGALGEASGL